MSERLRVLESVGLLSFLTDRLHGWARNKIKQRLRLGCVTVNGQFVTRHDFLLKAGDDVEVRAVATRPSSEFSQLEVLYSDRELIAVNKPAGLLSVGTPTEKKQHALSILRSQVSRPRRPVKLWPVHRLDRETSGVLLFATSLEIREAVMALWSEAEKTYLGVVEGHPNPSHGTIDQPLHMDNSEYRTHVGPHPEAKRAVTHFETESAGEGQALLKIKLETGRQHQIRAHLAWLGHPVIGDTRYGNGGPRLGLHALRLSIKRPGTSKRLTFETAPADDFLDLLQY